MVIVIKKKSVSILGILSFFLLGLLLINSCTNNKAELLYPPQTCDTITVTYTNVISPILSANCKGCHGGSNPADGIDFSSYSVVKKYVDNGDLYAAITHTSGYPAMPRNNDKLSDCIISKFRTWILAGAPDN